MSNNGTNPEIAKAHQEIATRNSRAAVEKVDSTRNELLERLNHLEQLVATQQQQITQLQQKYNLLLTKNFDGRATE